MARKRKKKESEEEAIPLSPETKIEEITKEETVEEEMIEEYKDYAKITEREPIPLSEPVKFSSLLETRKIKYLGTAGKFGTRGLVTGQRYLFTTKNRISEVAIEDYEGLLQRVRPARRCCGGKTRPERPYFGPV